MWQLSGAHGFEPQFNKADAVFGQILVLGDDVPMSAPSDADADHVDFRGRRESGAAKLPVEVLP
jgi:hypothetical protein